MAKLPAGVSKRADGTYRKRFTVNGKQYDVYAHTVRELPAKELEKRQELERGIYVENKRLTFDKYFEDWQSEHAKLVKGSTMAQHKLTYRNYISPTLGERKMQQLERREIVNWQDALISDGKSIHAANKALALLKLMLNDAIIAEVISVNPAATVKPLRDDKVSARETTHRALTEEEQSLLMQELRNSYYYEFIALLLCSGMRIGEAAALTWGDIDYKKRLIHVNKTVTHDAERNTVIGSPKSKTSARDIPINDSIETILKQAREKQAEINGNVLSMSNRIFNTPFGRIVTSTGIGFALDDAVNALNSQGHHIERITAHALRHTFATRFLEQRGDLETLKAILGHASIAITADLYGHVLTETKHKAMNMLMFNLPN